MQDNPNLTAYIVIHHGEATTLGEVQEARKTLQDYSGEITHDDEQGIIAKFTPESVDGDYDLHDHVQKVRNALDSDLESSSIEVQLDTGAAICTAFGKIRVRGTAVYMDETPVAKFVREQVAEAKDAGFTHLAITITGYTDEPPTLTVDD